MRDTSASHVSKALETKCLRFCPQCDGERQWDGATWSVLLPSLLHYPHAYPIAAAPYIMVLLVDMKKLEQQHGELSECICHICVSQSCIPSSLPHEEYFWVAGYTRVCSISLVGRADTRTVLINLLPMESRIYGRPSYNSNDNLRL